MLGQFCEERARGRVPRRAVDQPAVQAGSRRSIERQGGAKQAPDRPGGVLTCGLWCLLMVWSDRKRLPEPLRMGRLLLALNVLSGLFLTGWGVRGVIEFVAQL